MTNVTTTSDTIEFRFNTDYKDTEQVRQFMPAYLRRYAELCEAGKYPYNDSFRGHLGVTGDEDTAIYLCQRLRDLDEISVKVAAALADGYVPVGQVDTPIRCSSVIHYGFYLGGTGFKEFTDVRLVPGLTDLPAVLPKRARTRSVILLGGKVLAKVAP